MLYVLNFQLYLLMQVNIILILWRVRMKVDVYMREAHN